MNNFIEISSSYSERREIIVPCSKSYSNRILILASLVDRPIRIIDISDSSDVTTLINLLKRIGLDILVDDDRGVFVYNSFPDCERKGKGDEICFETGDGGTTNRFFTALLAKGRERYRLIPYRRMFERPMQGLFDTLRGLGVTAFLNEDDYSFVIQGPLQNDCKNYNVVVDGSETSQILSALKLSFYNNDINFISQGGDNNSVSNQYIKLTAFLIEQIKEGVSDFIIPPDFSSISYLLASGFFTSNYTLIKNCYKIDYLQADSIMIGIIKDLGGNLEFTEKGLLLDKKGKVTKGVDQDCSKCIDLTLTLAFICSYLPFNSMLRNLKGLIFKESNRIDTLLTLLSLFEVEHNYSEGDDVLYIKGSDSRKVSFKDYHPPCDHRAIMCAALFMKKNSGGRIYNFEHVDKSFPSFFEVL